MKTKTILYIVFSFMLFSGNAQNDSLSYKNGFWKNGEKLSKSTAKELVLNDCEALAKFKNAQTYEVIGYIIGCPSAYAFGYDLGTRLGGGQGNSTLLLVGGIGTAVGLFFSFSSEFNYKQSAIIFNKSRSRDKNLTSINWGLTPNGGIGLTLKF
jgi:hypothetical protein